MRFGVGVLALLIAAVVPGMLYAGATSLRGLGWFLVIAAVVVLLIDATDRVTDWFERRRGRRP